VFISATLVVQSDYEHKLLMMQLQLKIRKIFSNCLNVTNLKYLKNLKNLKNLEFRKLRQGFWLSLLTLLLTITFLNKSFPWWMEMSTAVALTPKSKVMTAYGDVAKLPKPQKKQEILSSSTVSSTASSTVTSTTSSTSLVEIGKRYYQNQQFAEAIAAWQQALEILISQRDSLNEALVSSNLAQAYQQLGNLKEADKAITRSLALLSPLEKQNPNFLAGVLNVQGSLLLSQGKAEDALAVWQGGAEIYKKTGNQHGLTRCLLNQTQALNALGMHRRAIATLKQVNQILENQPDSSLKLATLVNLGDTLRVMGDFPASESILQKSLGIAKGHKLDSDKLNSAKLDSETSDSETLDSGKLDSGKLDSETSDSGKLASDKLASDKLNIDSDVSQIFLALGNTSRFAGKTEEAVKYYGQAISTSKSPTTKIQAQLNQLSLLVEDTTQHPQALTLAAEIKPQLQNLPPSRTSVYALVNYVQNLKTLEGLQKSENLPEDYSASKIDHHQENAKILGIAVQQAKTIGDNRAESYALGYLGEMYQESEQFDLAQTLTEKALMVALSSNSPDISYRWQWQLGRLHKKQNNFPQAIAAYDDAVTTLRYIRNELVASNLDIQFSFRESVEPVYRELVSLLLTNYQGEVSQGNLKKARAVMESLQLAELDNYFHETCLKGHPTEIDNIDSQAAVIYPIILSERLEIVVSLPHKPLKHYSANISQTDLEAMVQKMGKAIDRNFVKNSHVSIVKEFYNLLIKPLAQDLSANEIKSLVFVLDGSLKTVPMAALYDGKEYLIQKYNIALAPGIQLLAPKPLKTKQLKILVGGLTEARGGFSALPAVENEVAQIKSNLPIESLLNHKFTSQTLQKEIAKTPFPVIHLATHGEFSSKAEDTFVLTWDSKINVKELGDILQTRQQDNRNPIELLVMSACKTASGDKRAPLGLAGVAVRSGARSTIASLWAVNDQSTSKLMTKFYQELAKSKSGITKAQALRNAQLEILKQPEFEHPYYWAPFVLIGNWL
jgi:CHAT domain-containing protein/predicted negative regulator of RcsB-dependent stress response